MAGPRGCIPEGEWRLVPAQARGGGVGDTLSPNSNPNPNPNLHSKAVAQPAAVALVGWPIHTALESTPGVRGTDMLIDVAVPVTFSFFPPWWDPSGAGVNVRFRGCGTRGRVAGPGLGLGSGVHLT